MPVVSKLSPKPGRICGYSRGEARRSSFYATCCSDGRNDELACVVAWLRLFSGFGFDSHALPPNILIFLAFGRPAPSRLHTVSNSSARNGARGAQIGRRP